MLSAEFHTFSHDHHLEFQKFAVETKVFFSASHKEPEALTKRHASSPMLYPAQLQVAGLAARGTTAVQLGRNTSNTKA